MDDLVARAQREATPATVVRALAAVLGALLALRVIFDPVLPTLLVVALGGVLALAALALGLEGLAEARRQRALLVALAQLSRMARLDPASRERIAPQVEALVDALRARPAPWWLPWKRP